MPKKQGKLYDKPDPRIINSIVYPDGSCVHMGRSSQGYGYFVGGNGPAYVEGVYLVSQPDDGTKSWKSLYKRALEEPVRDKWSD